MSITLMVFWFLALFLLIFGVAFIFFGMSSEKAYWFQRDPHGNPSREATPFRKVYAGALRIAFSNERAPLRIASIGVILVYLAILSAIVAIILTLVG